MRAAAVRHRPGRSSLRSSSSSASRSRSRSTRASVLLLTAAAVVVVIAIVGVRRSFADPPAPSPTPPPLGAAPVPAFGGGHVGAAEVSIVGGNVASARERALTEAFKQAVGDALGAAVPDAQATQPKTVVQVLGRARSYVRRYRTVDEGERGRGLYGVRIEADVDEEALRRVFDKQAPGGAASGSASAPTSSYLLVAAGAPEAGAAATRAFTAAGARVQPAGPQLADPNKAVEAAARAGLAFVAFVSGNATAEGKVRGPGVEASSCSIAVRVLAAGSGLAIADEHETARSFSDRADGARAGCFDRAAATVIPRVVPAAGARTAADLRTIVLDADVIDAGAVPALVKQLRGLGSVSAIEVRRIVAGRVELWVRSRLSGAALMTALGRDNSGALTFNAVEVTGDLVHAQARLREVAPPPAPPEAAPAATQQGGDTAQDTAAKVPAR